MTENTPTHVSRRTVLKASAAAGAAAVGGAAATGSAAAQGAGLEEWFSKTSNYDGVVDRTGKSEVTIEVGAQANNGPYGFGPAAIRVDPGTTVTWKWVKGTHNVQAKDGSYKSKLTGESGFTFSHTFESEGVSKYFCMPHKAMGMKGAVVVGDVDVGGSSSSSSGGSGGSGGSSHSVDFGGWFENTSNFDGVVDETGKSEVTVEVGAQANNGSYGFAPAAIRVDPGTTVTWKWVKGTHNVQAKDGSYKSKLTGESGFTFSHTFESEGVSKYFCMPHKAMGMKGAVVVGSAGGSSGSSAPAAATGGDSGNGLSTEELGVLGFAGVLTAGLLSPFVAKAFGNSDSDRR
ncbi:MAG: halocyanin domain-containing protein [Halobacterium sp.]